MPLQEVNHLETRPPTPVGHNLCFRMKNQEELFGLDRQKANMLTAFLREWGLCAGLVLSSR